MKQLEICAIEVVIQENASCSLMNPSLLSQILYFLPPFEMVGILDEGYFLLTFHYLYILYSLLLYAYIYVFSYKFFYASFY